MFAAEWPERSLSERGFLYKYFIFAHTKTKLIRREEIKMPESVFTPKKKIYLTHCSSVAGKAEGEGPLREAYDFVFDKLTPDEASWEQEEAKLVQLALNTLLKKSSLTPGDLDLILGGDLMNQCTSTSFGVKDSDVCYFGLYGACSTYALSALIGAIAIESGFARRCVFGASSNFSTAERQFRTPLEYGGQRSPTAQCTVTGCGMGLLEENAPNASVVIHQALCGRIVDAGITDVTNMGAAMAPAAADTLLRFFRLTNTSPADYDCIATGDLGLEGNRLLKEILRGEGISGVDSITDCGLLIYDRQKQDMHCGGSGCACSALVCGAHLFPAMQRGELHKLLLVGTGALMSPMTLQQGLSIPSIAHLIHFQKEEAL